jgi:L-asparaginase / beta-aspartyl-peptidase
MLAGRAADALAKELGFEAVNNDYFTVPLRKSHWEQFNRLGSPADAAGQTEAVGAVVLDSKGNLAVGGSSGGPTGKMEGRVGDAAILGAGLHADASLGVLW